MFFNVLFYFNETGPRARIESVLKNYQEGDYDFGIDTNAVMNITGYEMDDAKDLLSSLSKNDSGMYVIELFLLLNFC